MLPIVFVFGAYAVGEVVDGTTTDEDWTVDTDTVIENTTLTMEGDVTVLQGVTLTIRNSTLVSNHSFPHQYELRARAGATLEVYGSELRLDMFAAEDQSALVFEGSTIDTTGWFLARSNSLFATDCVFLNTAPDGLVDEDGETALFIANGRVNSEFVRTMIFNTGGNAGSTSPGMNGSRGGDSILITNVSSWIDCEIECEAGLASGGGLGLTGTSGGSGGLGADVKIQINALKLDGTEIMARASYGGVGARGASNSAGNGGDGGDGRDGGDAVVTIAAGSGLEISDCTFKAIAGMGGPGGAGGDATDGDGGAAGEAGNGGTASIEVSVNGNISIRSTCIETRGGDGGYGGDHGRLVSGTGNHGPPSEGGDGGDANIAIKSTMAISLHETEVIAMGGSGLDGGNGYEQGEQGGDAGNAKVSVRADTKLHGEKFYLRSHGGRGGDGGIAYSEILGNGGDGGDAHADVLAAHEMELRDFRIECHEGQGGKGNTPIWYGADGFATLDLDTHYLEFWDAYLNRPLDDLHGGAEGHLYNVTFDVSIGIPVLPVGDAHVWSNFPVIAVVSDSPDPDKAKRLEGYEVTVIDWETSALVDVGLTNDRGECFFYLKAYYYSPTAVKYLGSYRFIASTPDGMTTKTVRGEIEDFTAIYITFSIPTWIIDVHIEQPVEGTRYTLVRGEDRYFETYGNIRINDDEEVYSVSVELITDGSGPSVTLERSDVPPSKLEDQDDRWGRFFPPEEFSDRWKFFARFDMMEEDMPSGEYTCGAIVNMWGQDTSVFITFDLSMVDPPNVSPEVNVTADILGIYTGGGEVIILGEATDDTGIVLVEVQVDLGPWEPVEGTTLWSYTLDFDGLEEGDHSIFFRAFDGEEYSEVARYWFTVEKAEGDNGDEDDGLDAFTVGGIIIAVTLAFITIAAMMYRRVTDRLERRE